jgi:hypothetical protein
MRERSVILVSIICATVVACVLVYFANNRYILVKGEDVTYKTDRRTGVTVALYGDVEVAIEVEKAAKELTKSERAIALAKEAKTADSSSYPLTNSHYIESWLSKQKGSLKVIGWSAQDVGDDTFLVSFKWQQKEYEKSIAFEVMLGPEIVRNVTGDDELELQYEISK